jgi:hypothetical protein
MLNGLQLPGSHLSTISSVDDQVDIYAYDTRINNIGSYPSQQSHCPLGFIKCHSVTCGLMMAKATNKRWLN